jgi:hypothetical protein
MCAEVDVPNFGRTAVARGWVLLTLLALTWFSTVPAKASTDMERAGARSAATSGADAFDAGRYQDALDLFLRAESLVHSPVHLSYIGQSQAKLGLLVEARETFLKLKREKLADDAPEVVRRAVSEASAHVNQIEPRLAYLSIKVEGLQPAEAASVTVDGTPISPALLGIAAPSNPGPHTIRATAPGKDSGDVHITLTEGQRQEVAVTLNTTGQPVAAATAALSNPPSKSAAAPTSETAEVDSGVSGNSLRIFSYAALGVGAVGVGVGAYFAFSAKSAADEADAMCGGSRANCTLVSDASRQAVEEKNDEAGSSRTLAIVGFAVGGVGLAAGATMLLLSLDDGGTAAEQTAGITPYVGLGETGVIGRF